MIVHGALHFFRIAVCLLTTTGVMMNAAESHLVADQETGRVILEKDAHRQCQIASLTKIATAVVALEWIDARGGEADQIVTIIPEAVSGGANPLKLRAGDRLTLAGAIHAAMMASDNTSAYALAAALGSQMKPGSDAPGAVAAFVEKMNALATRLGMQRTRFSNPHGLDGGRADGFSTASDIARLAIHACDRPDFLNFCREKEYQITIQRDGADVALTITNTNEIVGSRGIDGMKTGTTRLSGPCLVTTATRGLASGGGTVERRLVVVVLKAEDRFRETILLLDEAWPACQNWLEEGAVIDANEHLRKNGK